MLQVRITPEIPSVPDEVFMARPLRPSGLEGVWGSFVVPPTFDE